MVLKFYEEAFRGKTISKCSLSDSGEKDTEKKLRDIVLSNAGVFRNLSQGWAKINLSSCKVSSWYIIGYIM